MSTRRAGLRATALLLGVLLLTSQSAPGQQTDLFTRFVDPTGAAPERPTGEPPAYSILRYNEDYSYLRDPARRTDVFDPLKFIPLDGAGTVYLTLGGDMRQRFETYSGFGLGNGSINGRTDDYYLSRYMLHADLHLGDAVRIFAQFKSDEEIGRRGGPRPGIDEDHLDLHQAFVDVRLPLAADASLLVRLGRQELSYGSGRLIDFREGPNVRQSFDAVRLAYTAPGVQVDGLYARQVATNHGVFDDSYDVQQASLWGMYSTLDLPFARRRGSGDVAQLDLYYLGLDRENAVFDQAAGAGPLPVPAHETRHSLGGRLHGKLFPLLADTAAIGEFHYDLEGLCQFGRYGRAEVSAWTASADVGYFFKDLPFGPNLSLRADVASGDANPHDGTLGTFNPLFPRGSYFTEPGFIGPSNLIALHPVVDWHLCKGLGLVTTVVGYWRQDTGDGIYNFGGFPSVSGPGVMPNPGQPASRARFVGTEANAWLTWGINRHVTLDLSYSHFFAGGFIKDTPSPTGSKSFNYFATGSPSPTDHLSSAIVLRTGSASSHKR